MIRHFDNLRLAFGQVFGRFAYLALAAVLAVVAFLLAVWLPNLGLIAQIVTGSNAPIAAKISILLSLLGGIWTNFSLFSAGYTVAIAMLFGVNTAMIVYLFRQRRAAVAAGQNIALGTGGIASGVLGIGCAACGSLIASSALSFVGAGSALALLPLSGGEFGILSVALLLLSLLLISRNLAQPVCPLPGPAEASATSEPTVIRKSN